MTVTHREMLAWVRPWPIRWKSRAQYAKKWRVSFMSAQKAARTFRSFWQQDRSVAYVAKRLDAIQPGRAHHVAYVALRGVHHPAIVVSRAGVVLDGNHTLTALLHRKGAQVLVFREAA